MARYMQITLAVALALVALSTAVPTGGYGGYGGSSLLGGYGAESYSSQGLGLGLGVGAPLLLSAPSAAYAYEKEPEIIAYPRYAFKYGVEDPKTGDYKDQAEERDGDVVKGEYSLLQPDGRKRVVKYQSDKKNGFNAIVSYSGHAVHPEQVRLVKAY